MSARNRNHDEGGFTLVEVLVSLAIFSIAIVGLQRAATLALRGTSQLELRTHAGFVADNAVALNRIIDLRVGEQEAQAESGGIAFEVLTETRETDLQDFYEVRVGVRQQGTQTVIASRRSFRRAPPLRDPQGGSEGDEPDDFDDLEDLDDE